MTSSAPERLITDHRGTRYGEVLAVFAEGDRFIAHVYGTQLLNDCPAELWAALDATAIAGELGALIVKLNGPATGCSTGWARRAGPSSRCSTTSPAF